MPALRQLLSLLNFLPQTNLHNDLIIYKLNLSLRLGIESFVTNPYFIFYVFFYLQPLMFLLRSKALGFKDSKPEFVRNKPTLTVDIEFGYKLKCFL